MTEVSFGEWLRRQRMGKGLTREQLAQQIGCAVVTLRKIEAEERRPSVQMTERFADFLDIPQNERTNFLRFARGDWQAAPPGIAENAPWRISPVGKREAADVSTPKIRLVTFFFTDIEGSAKLWEQAPKKMKVALQRHHTILQGAITSNGGAVFQIVGDAFCAAFPTVQSAIVAAVTAQQELYQEQWDLPFPIRVRVGIHTGEAEQTSDSPLLGGYASNQTLNRVARILSAAHGGQVLLSLATTDLIKDSLPANTELHDMGEHHLKNLIHPEHLFQLNISGLPSEFPPLNTLTHRHNLPVQLTSFIGREHQLAELHDYLMRAEIRLVTLIGPPGIGKTRLSIEAARQSLSDFADGVFFVGLAALDDAKLILVTVRQALGYVENQKLPADEHLMQAIGEKQMLIVLDNCEHLIKDVAEFAARLLLACSRLKILATSREVLRIPGEWLYSVPVLGIPVTDLPVNTDNAAEFPALPLFAERARAVRSDFVLGADNIRTVAEICAALDGLPLAIELIAAQMRLHSPHTLLERLNEKFVLSAEGMRTAPPRQISLRHAFNWSYDSLTLEEQKVFAGLSVFSGSFTLEAAEAIFSGTVMELSVYDLVTSLLDKSLLQRSSNASAELRFSMLATIQYFARERLRTFGDAEKIRDRHLTYFLEITEQAAKEIHGPQQLRWLDHLEHEQDNLRAALTWALESKKADEGLRLVSGLFAFWFIRGYLREGISWLERALSQSEGASKIWVAKALNYLGDMLSTGENPNLDRTMLILERSLHLYQELDDKAGIAWVLNNLGIIAHGQKDYKKAKQLLTESLALRYAIGDPWSIAQTLQNLPPIALQENDYIGARELAVETIEWFRRAGDQRGVARTLADLAEFERVTGNPAQAVALLRQSLPPLMDVKDRWSIASVLQGLAALANTQNDSQRAARLYGAAGALLETMGMSLSPDARVRYEHNFELIQKNLSDPTFIKAWAEGHTMTMEQAVAYALEE